MITESNAVTNINGIDYPVETFYGLSSDTKPALAGNGSSFYEMDTGKTYLFSVSDADWYEQPDNSGGGGGGGVLVVHDVDGTLDKTFKEINDAWIAGVLPIVVTDYGFLYMTSEPVVADLKVSFSNFSESLGGDYFAESENGYPVLDQGGLT